MALNDQPREAARLLRRVRSLADMSAEIAAAHDFATSARLLLLTLLGSLSATRGAIWLSAPDRGRLELAVARGLDLDGESLALAEEEVAALQQAGAAIPMDPLREGPTVLREVRARWPELVVAVPLVARDEFIGLLTIGAKLSRQEYSQPELELLHTMATMAASGIHSHNLIRGLQQANQQLVEAQEQLLRSEQLATLGATAAGIAHEIGNPLTAILGYAITMREMADELTPELCIDLLQPIVDEAERLKQILEELKDYAKPKGYELEPLPISAVIEDTLRFTRYDRLFRNRVQVRPLYEGDPVVLVNRTKLKQVLLNLLKNAAQAMEGQERPPSITVLAREADGAATIEVIDNGPGIPPNRLDRIWEPFFTTKGTGGTGLGLDLCRQIVQRHGGQIGVESEVGGGTTFTIRLPLADEAGAGETRAPAKWAAEAGEP